MLARDHGGPAGFQNAGLSDARSRPHWARESLMIEIDRRDDADGRRFNDIGGVKPPAKAHFQHDEIRRGFSKDQKRRRGDRLEISHANACRGDPIQGGEKASIVEQTTRHAHALIGRDQMRRGEHMRAQAGRFGDGAQKGAGGAFAIGAGDMNHRRQRAFGMAQPLEADRDPRQIDRQAVAELQADLASRWATGP
jgi:hypothetical protein